MGIDHVIDVRRAVDLLDMLDQGLARCLGAAVVNNDFVSVGSPYLTAIASPFFSPVPT